MLTFSILVVIIVFVLCVLNLPVFGRLPSGGRLEQIKSLANYKFGEIHNLSHTPVKRDDASYVDLFRRLIKGNKSGTPNKALPHRKPDFKNDDDLNITWFGHSSYLIQVDGKNILVDPVFSERTSPFQFIGTKNFEGTNFFRVQDLPHLDLVLITHDHYDHLDYLTILELKYKTANFITSIGVGSHLQRWGIEPSKIIEMTWGGEFSPFAEVVLIATSARHFSGRKFKRNQTAWSSFILKTKHKKIYIGGDSGYDTHFAAKGAAHGPFDLAILECGQYDEMWPYIHMFPEQVLQAAEDLNAKCVLPVHWGKFKLALHDWDEPINLLTKKADELNYPILTPMLGETFGLKETSKLSKWWLNL